MIKPLRLALLLFISCCFFTEGYCQSNDLKVVIIRHGEKSEGDNLSCQGLNRSLFLTKVLYSKYGKASIIFVPTISVGDKTKWVGMLQTITPYAVKYNLNINSSYGETEYRSIVKAVKKQTGTVVVVWDNTTISQLTTAFGVTQTPEWPDNDYDSIWVITYKDGKAALTTTDKEGLKPAMNCPF